MPEGHRSPVLKVFVLCDTLLQDKTTDQVTLVGIRDEVRARTFPYEYRVSAFARLTEAAQVRTVQLDLVDLVDMSRSLILEHTVVKGPNLDPFGFFVLSVHQERVVFPKAGDYEVILSANGSTLGGHKLRVTYE
jgi:hypothetical protein